MVKSKGLQIVVFRVGRELFGVGIDRIQEIVRVPEITEVPDAPFFLEGVINLRGRVIPVIDLRKRLRFKDEARSKSTRVLIAESGENRIGLLVDAVAEVRKIHPDAVEEPPEMISAVGVEYISAVVKNEGSLIILLDLQKILNINDMKKVEETTFSQKALPTAS